MIRTMTFIVCDCCDARLQCSTWEEPVAFYEAQQRGWHAEYNPTRHYCPACKVPVKLAKAMGAKP